MSSIRSNSDGHSNFSTFFLSSPIESIPSIRFYFSFDTQSVFDNRGMSRVPIAIASGTEIEGINL
jgi:hypothetical protein